MNNNNILYVLLQLFQAKWTLLTVSAQILSNVFLSIYLFAQKSTVSVWLSLYSFHSFRADHLNSLRRQMTGSMLMEIKLFYCGQLHLAVFCFTFPPVAFLTHISNL